MLDDGSTYAAPSYLDSAISHVSGMFKRMGRVREYDPVQEVSLRCTRLDGTSLVNDICYFYDLLQVGNPCCDASITAFH